jgi:hypothetical protein
MESVRLQRAAFDVLCAFMGLREALPLPFDFAPAAFFFVATLFTPFLHHFTQRFIGSRGAFP